MERVRQEAASCSSRRSNHLGCFTNSAVTFTSTSGLGEVPLGLRLRSGLRGHQGYQRLHADLSYCHFRIDSRSCFHSRIMQSASGPCVMVPVEHMAVNSIALSLSASASRNAAASSVLKYLSIDSPSSASHQSRSPALYSSKACSTNSGRQGVQPRHLSRLAASPRAARLCGHRCTRNTSRGCVAA